MDDPYGSFSFSSELVFEKIPWAAAHHCSTICEAGNGDLLCLWYGGSYEAAYARMRNVWESQGAGDRLVTKIWPVPHVFNEAMQQEAFDWLDKWLQGR